MRKLSGLEDVFATEMLAEHLAKAARGRPVKTIYTPTGPAEGFATSRDLALRAVADAANDPWDGRLLARGPLRGPAPAAGSPSFEVRT